MSRRSALIGLGIATVALAIFLAAIDPSRVEDGLPNIVDFEFAGSQERAAEIVNQWGDEGQDHARLSLWVDFAYLLAYGTFLTLAAAATRDLAARRGRRRLAAFGVFAIPAAAAGAAFDAIEDVCLLIALEAHGGDAAPRLASICAGLKFALVAVAILYLVAGLAARIRAGGSTAGGP